jgi:hypothetical protein
MDEESLEEIARVYETVVKAGVYRAESIRWQKLQKSSKTPRGIST